MSQGQIFTGTSRNGSLQEALEAAVREATAAAPNPVFYTWSLAGITGEQGGFVGADVVNVSIRVGLDGGRGDVDAQPAASATAAGDGGEAEVPTTRNGLVARLEDDYGICMDGATFELVSQAPDGEHRLRLKPTNDEARDVLDRLAGSRQDVTVTGYLRYVECERMDVYHATPTHLGAAGA